MDLNLILGPIVLGVSINSFLYGTCVIQWFNYLTSGYRDPWYTRFLVFWVIVLDTFHSAAAIYMLWQFTVPNFGNPLIFTHVPWPYPITPVFSIASVPIQHFLAWRIKCFSRSWALFGLISIISLTQGACGFAGGILATISSDPASFSRLLAVADSWVSLAAFTDVLITFLLLVYLHRSKTGFKHTDSVIARLIRIAVETSAIGLIVCIVDLVVFTTRTQTNLHFLFALPQPRIYTNTLMMTLNSRKSLREEMSSGNVQLSSNDVGRFRPTEVSIAVSQDIQLDKMQSSPVTSTNSPRSYYDDELKIRVV